MGYSTSDSVVRVDRFRPRGKWYDSHAIDMGDYYRHDLIHQALWSSLIDAGFTRAIVQEWMWVCLEPYHQHSHPIVLMPRQQDEDPC